MNDNGNGSLRAAITALNNTPKNQNNQILFQKGAQPLSGTISLQSALDPINRNVTVSGTQNQGMNLITVAGNASAANPYSVFKIAADVTVNIDFLSIDGGYGASGNGGGIDNFGTLTLANDTVYNNSALGSGGGILNHSLGTLKILNDTIQGNTAATNGGGIMKYGTISDAPDSQTTISNNTAKSGSGGGVFNSGKLTFLCPVFIQNNTASAYGGGIYNSVGESLKISTTSSITGNTATSKGGGICNYGTATLTSVSFSGNSANQGGGLYVGDGSTTVLNSDTVSGNKLIGNNPNGKGIYEQNGATAFTMKGTTDSDDPGGKPFQGP